METDNRQNWRKSTRSTGSGSCVEVLSAGGVVLIRDSKYLRDPANRPASQPVITVPADAWATFIEVVLDADAQLAPGLPKIDRRKTGTVTLCAEDGTRLDYTSAEWDAFTAGARDGEFALGGGEFAVA